MLIIIHLCGTGSLPGRREEVWHRWTNVRHHPGKQKLWASKERCVCVCVFWGLSQTGKRGRSRNPELLFQCLMPTWSCLDTRWRRASRGKPPDPWGTSCWPWVGRVPVLTSLPLSGGKDYNNIVSPFSVKCARSVPTYFAETLYYSMKVGQDKRCCLSAVVVTVYNLIINSHYNSNSRQMFISCSFFLSSCYLYSSNITMS